MWMLCIAIRLLNALLVRTYFNPDEHWQALEVAHKIAFGYGHLTWEWSRGLRSYLHPLVFAALYKFLEVFQLDSPWMMARAPRLFQALFAAANDVYLWKLARRMHGDHAAKWTLVCQWINWFTFFCMVRTLSNSLETTLTTMALFYWSTDLHLALLLAWISCAIRPTSAIVWVYVGSYHLYKCENKLKYLFSAVLPIGAAVLGLTCVIDRWMYRRWIFVPLNFIRFNLLSAGGDFYGTHSWHWYFTQGFLVMVFTQLPLTVHGIWRSKHRQLAGLIAWILIMYSFLGHKEFRFVLPALPLAMLFAGYSLSLMNSKTRKMVLLGLVLTNVPVALYTSLLHQRGSETVVEYLAEEAAESRVQGVVFLTQCHATPFYSTLHRDVPMKFLDCSPSNEDNYKDEAHQFMEDPLATLSLMYNANATLPSHVVLFDLMEAQLKPFLEAHSYKMAKRFFHAHVPVDRELQSYMLLYTL